MRRKDDTLRDTLLEYARELADSEGLEAVNIRSIAGKAGVAAGTVYNYFAGKDEILLALTEDRQLGRKADAQSGKCGGYRPRKNGIHEGCSGEKYCPDAGRGREGAQ